MPGNSDTGVDAVSGGSAGAVGCAKGAVSPADDLSRMSNQELQAYTENRARELTKIFEKSDPGGATNTTLSVGIVELVVDGKSNRKVVVTTSDDNQKLDPAVNKALGPNEEFRETEPTLIRGDRYPNPDYNPNGPKDRRNNPKTKTDSMIVDPKTKEKHPYTKAENGKPVEGTQHHAEQRMQNATKEGETLVTQQPSKSCCAGCTEVLGTTGLAKVPNPNITTRGK